MLTHGLIDKDSRTILAMSAGVDSQVLGHIFKHLYHWGYLQHEPRSLHINHHTRNENEHDKDLQCVQTLYPDCFIEHISSTQKSEHVFRVERAQIYHKYSKKYNALIVTAHHLDDAFEWSMMQSFKSSSLRSTLGIPIKNKFLIRPLMCLGKKQILNYAQRNKIKSHPDSTSTNLQIERNNFRENILPNIKSRYPRYLEHFVRRSKQLHSQLKSSHKFRFSDFGDYHIHYLETISTEDVTESIQKLSTNPRGMLAREVEKLMKAIKNQKSGPMNFSGGVRAFIFNTFILITNLERLHISNQIEQKKMNFYQFDHFLRGRKGLGFSEQFIFVEDVKFASQVNHPILSVRPSCKKLVESLHFRNKWQKEHKYLNKQLEFSIFQ